jgi:hypothetical protein
MAAGSGGQSFPLAYRGRRLPNDKRFHPRSAVVPFAGPSKCPVSFAYTAHPVDDDQRTIPYILNSTSDLHPSLASSSRAWKDRYGLRALRNLFTSISL